MELARRVARNVVYNTAALFTGSVSGLILSITLARLLKPENFGVYSLVITIVNLTVAIVMSGMDNSLIRYISYYENKGNTEIIRSIFRYILKVRIIFTLLISTVIIIFSSEMSRIFGNENLKIPIIVAGLIIFTRSLITLFSSFLKGVQNFKIYFINQILYEALRLSIIVILAYLYFVVGALLGLLIANIVSLVVLILILLRKYRAYIVGKVHSEKIPGLRSYVGFMTIANISGIVFTYIDILMIGAFIGVVGVAYYRASSTIIFALLGLITSLANVLLPVFSQFEKEDISKALEKINKYVSMVVFPFAVTFGLFSHNIISVIYGREYFPSGDVLMLLSLLLIVGTFSYFGSVVNAMGRADLSAYIVLIGTTINILLNYLLILKIGIIGAAIATVVSRFIILVILIFTLKYILKVDPALKVTIKPIISILPVVILYMIFPKPVNVVYGVILIFTGFLVYMVVLLALDGLNKKDIIYLLKILGIG